MLILIYVPGVIACFMWGLYAEIRYQDLVRQDKDQHKVSDFDLIPAMLFWLALSITSWVGMVVAIIVYLYRR